VFGTKLVEMIIKMQEILQLVISIATLLGFIFIIYKTFRDPDVKADKAIALLKADLVSQKSLTAEEIKTNQNCIHELNEKMIGLTSEVGKVNVSIAELATIINERIPRKI